MPVLKGNSDEYSHARPLVASIKKGIQNWKRPADVTDFVDSLITETRPDEDFAGADQVDSLDNPDGEKGLTGQSYSSLFREASFQPMGTNSDTPQQSLDLMSLSPLLMPGFFRGTNERSMLTPPPPNSISLNIT